MTEHEAREEFGSVYDQLPETVRAWLRDCPFAVHHGAKPGRPPALFVALGQLRESNAA